MAMVRHGTIGPMPSFDRFRALSFDCYGTLIDWEAGIVAALRRWLDGRRTDLDDEALLAAFADLETGVQAADPGARYPVVLAAVLARLGERLGLSVGRVEAEAFGASVGDWPAFPDSPEALARLASRFRLIILSNIDRASFARSNERLGVRFDAIVTAEDIGSYKPDPRNFVALLSTAAGLGVAKGQLLHVAQSLYHDHVPAKAIGLSTVWIDRRAGRVGGGATPAAPSDLHPDWTFPTLAAFADAVDEAEALEATRAVGLGE
jgi:putative hydrolase of the HAD superfamily